MLYFRDIFFIMYILVLIRNVDSLYINGINIKVINMISDNTIMIINIVDIILLNFFLKKHFNGYKKYAIKNDIKKGSSGFIIFCSTTFHIGYNL